MPTSPAETQWGISTAWRENNLCDCTLSLSNKSEKGRFILRLISRMWKAKAAVWKALHAWNTLSFHSLSHCFQKNLMRNVGVKENREKIEMGKRYLYELFVFVFFFKSLFNKRCICECDQSSWEVTLPWHCRLPHFHLTTWVSSFPWVTEGLMLSC